MSDPSENKTARVVRAGVVGVGGIGRNHARIYAALPEVELAAVHDTDAARARDLAAVDGLGMLLHQGRRGFQAWFGTMPAVDAELRAFVASDIPRTAA